MNIDIILKCYTCRATLDGEVQVKPNQVFIVVQPCEVCLDNARDAAHAESADS
jgi:hypothetical protein